ncbi:MAG: Crp/Fnr family transcriptional regulator [Actinomycetota bacterium]|nr:Crp/Fnr family transcriptional regulator [Actinomycetota bacterium]MDP3630958.1 Crp/Fnr family transcriptional regulator [Actinomycetota bacterium]
MTDKRDMNVPQTDIIAKLHAFPMFSDLREDDLAALAAMVTLKQYTKGSFVISQNDHGSVMYLLVAGRVKVSLASPEGRELALNYLEAPSHFGEMSLVDAEPRSADVIAVSDCEVLALDARDLSAAIQVQPKLALTLIATLSRRVRGLIGRLEDMAFHDASHRVMRVILNVATASYEARGVPVVEGLTHYEVATLAGTSRETASRVISQLAKDGVVATKGRRVIVDLFALRDRIEGD